MRTLKSIAGDDTSQYLHFDSSFESGNLDMAVQVGSHEYDLYMRVDSNTRGHHQWFYFKVNNHRKTQTVKFNIVNFTKKNSLYMHGMRVNVKSMKEFKDKKNKHIDQETKVKNNPDYKFNEGDLANYGWVKTGDKIVYKLSKLSQPSFGQYNSTTSHTYTRDGDSEYQSNVHQPARKKKYYMVSFEYTFKKEDDVVYFAYALPYTFSKLFNFIRETVYDHDMLIQKMRVEFDKQ